MFETENQCKNTQAVVAIDGTIVFIKAPVSASRHDYYCPQHVLKLC